MLRYNKDTIVRNLIYPHHNSYYQNLFGFRMITYKTVFSYDVREDIEAIGKHWYDDGNLGGRAFFGGENKTSYLSLENLKYTDQGAYRCRVDFKQAPSQIYKLYLEVVGRNFSCRA